MGWIASMGRSPKNGRTWRRSRISVAASVVGLRLGSVDHTAHHSSAHRLNGSRGGAGGRPGGYRVGR
jgi:hypothetical protein